jgi:lipopolysaccharide export system permease protein
VGTDFTGSCNNPFPVAVGFFNLLAQAIIAAMRILDIYIGSRFLNYFFLITLILMVLFSLFELLSQLDDVGKGSYRLHDAFTFVALTLPKRLLDLMPVSTLLGGILALGLMADHGELVAMEASGVSILRICATVLVTGILLIVTSGILAELVVPGMEQLARKSHAKAITATGITLTQQGFWARRENAYIHVEQMLSEGVAANIDVFEFDKGGRLQAFSHAQKATLLNNRQWVLEDITEKRIVDNEVTTKKLETETIDSFLSAYQVSILELPPYSLSIPDLIRYIEALRQTGQNAAQYSVALWRKITVPLTTGAMVLLSLSFVFGATRSNSPGYRITLGAFIGIVLYFADQIVMQWGMLLNLNPFITAMLPVLLISSTALVRLRNVF